MIKPTININDVYNCLRCITDDLNKDYDYECRATCDTKEFCTELFKLLKRSGCEKGARDYRKERR